MVIRFDSTYFTTSNASYSAGTTYYVEGVGTSNGIELVAEESEAELFLGDSQIEWDRGDYPGWVNSTTAPDNIDAWDMNRWDVVPDIATPDYITIQRGSRDKNPWSRTNGWIHKDVVSPGFQVSNTRKGKRPIIEFKKDIELYNYGLNHVKTVDLLSETETVDTISGAANVTIDGITLQDDQLILFRNENFDYNQVTWDGQTPWDHDSDNDASTGGGQASSTNISAITLNDPIEVDTSAPHTLRDGQPVTFNGIVGTTQLNSGTYYVDVISATKVRLYSDQSLQTTLNGTVGYTAYSSGGNINGAAGYGGGGTGGDIAVSYTHLTLPTKA